jgi:membrane associated rhomboid family serine protease
MKTAEELEVLKVVAASLDGTSSQRREARAFVWGGLILGWVCMAGSMYLVLDSALSPFAGAAIAAFGGIVGGFAIFWSMSLTQWQVIKHHIDENSLNARIKEIET